nr:hypothetical protein [Sorangium aterium]
MLNEPLVKSNGAAPLRALHAPHAPAMTSAGAEETLPHTTMRVKKRNGSSEPVDVNKIVGR